MIRTYGEGRPTTIVDRLDHHAEALTPLAAALMNGLLASKIARDDRVHQLHLGRGAGGVNLYLDNGAKFAFRAGVDEGGQYERVEILDAPKEGVVIATVRNPEEVPKAITVIEAAL
jgi:hypothetical protein